MTGNDIRAYRKRLKFTWRTPWRGRQHHRPVGTGDPDARQSDDALVGVERTPLRTRWREQGSPKDSPGSRGNTLGDGSEGFHRFRETLDQTGFLSLRVA